MREFFEDDEESANDPAHEVRLQALADMVDAKDMLDRGGALQNILVRAFDDAKVALAALVNVETTDDAVRALQNEVRRYDDLVRYVRDIINAGEDAAKELDDGAREELMKTVRGEDDDYED